MWHLVPISARATRSMRWSMLYALFIRCRLTKSILGIACLKVEWLCALLMYVGLLTHALTHSFIHQFIHSFIHSTILHIFYFSPICTVGVFLRPSLSTRSEKADHYLKTRITNDAVRVFALTNFIPGTSGSWRINMDAIVKFLPALKELPFVVPAAKYNVSELELDVSLLGYKRPHILYLMYLCMHEHDVCVWWWWWWCYITLMHSLGRISLSFHLTRVRHYLSLDGGQHM